MQSILEKVLMLKAVSLFSAIPDDILVEVAAILHEETLFAGQTLFRLGDHGTSMYIIRDGQVRVHNNTRTLSVLGTGDFFGEMALLDAAPRVASVTAIEDTRLFRLDQDLLYELMADYREIVHNLVRVFSERLRARVQDIADLHRQLEALDPNDPLLHHV